MKRILPLVFVGLMTTSVAAHDAAVLEVRMQQVGMLWNIHVTVEHPDTGWDHYADGWEVQDAQGNVLAFRELMHPHVNEQPFTRSISGVVIPDGTKEVFVRGRCSVHGWSDQLFRIEVKR